MSLEITPFAPGDCEEALDLWSRSEGIGLRGPADTPSGLARYLERNPGGSFVARERGTLVGAVLCGHDGRRGYLHHLAVAEGHRRRGIGTALANRCLDWLRSEGLDRCHLFVHAGNQEAERFWSRHGWASRGDIRTMTREVPAGR